MGLLIFFKFQLGDSADQMLQINKKLFLSFQCEMNKLVTVGFCRLGFFYFDRAGRVTMRVNRNWFSWASIKCHIRGLKETEECLVNWGIGKKLSHPLRLSEEISLLRVITESQPKSKLPSSRSDLCVMVMLSLLSQANHFHWIVKTFSFPWRGVISGWVFW